MPLSPTYQKNVFLNCPFDDGYKPIFNATIFVVAECGFIPRCALEAYDSGQNRLEKIMEIIADCRLSIHDISSTKLDKANKLPRFNMPFELGLFLGARQYGDQDQQTKKCLVLDVDKYRYQKFLSDISGQDISAHGNDVKKAMEKIRDFLVPFATGIHLPGAQFLKTRYDAFMADFPLLCGVLHLDPAEAKYGDFVHILQGWHNATP